MPSGAMPCASCGQPCLPLADCNSGGFQVGSESARPGGMPLPVAGGASTGYLNKTELNLFASACHLKGVVPAFVSAGIQALRTNCGPGGPAPLAVGASMVGYTVRTWTALVRAHHRLIVSLNCSKHRDRVSAGDSIWRQRAWAAGNHPTECVVLPCGCNCGLLVSLRRLERPGPGLHEPASERDSEPARVGSL